MTLRIAAVGDIHFTHEPAPAARPHYAELASHADLLLLAGDLTQRGLVEEAAALADALGAAGVPVVAVLGNHDYHHEREQEIAATLEAAGVRVLEKQSAVFEIRGVSVGVAGVKGFCGGFGMSSGSEFGEPEMKRFIRAAKVSADALYRLLAALDCDLRIALTHFSPTRDTLAGERLDLHPFLGSYLLGDAIDRAGCDLAIHGHAHHGAERGLTPGGVPVRNVAMPVISAPYNVYTFELPAVLADGAKQHRRVNRLAQDFRHTLGNPIVLGGVKDHRE